MSPVSALIAKSADVLATGPAPYDDEVALAERFQREEDRSDFLAARVLTRWLVAKHTGCAEVRFAQTCRECDGLHGRPRVVGDRAHVGWSHASGMVGAVVADVPCAIDIESLPVLRGRLLPLSSLTKPEQSWIAAQPDETRAFAQLWVRKELLVKLGEAALDEVLSVNVLPALSGRRVLGRTLLALDTAAYDAVGAYSSDAGSGWRALPEDRAYRGPSSELGQPVPQPGASRRHAAAGGKAHSLRLRRTGPAALRT